MNNKIQPLHIADAKSAIRHVFIRNLELLARIGIHGHEQGMAQPVRINVSLWTQTSAADDRLAKYFPDEKFDRGAPVTQ